MYLHLIDKLLFLTIIVVIATVLWNFYPYRSGRKEDVSASDIMAGVIEMDRADPIGPVTAVEMVEAVTPAPLVVRHLSDQATLLVRHQATKHGCTAHLIIWSGAKRKRISDSYYDLGLIKAVKLSGEVVDEFLVMAKERLDELAQAGKRKRKTEQADRVGESIIEVVEPVQAEVGTAPERVETPAVVVEDSPPELTKLKRFPSVYRGVITEVGMMKQTKDSREFETFGVRYRTQEGIVEAVFGANLRTALQEANAQVGDTVEILKIGRKTIDKGKAPMNLFKVAKLQAST